MSTVGSIEFIDQTDLGQWPGLVPCLHGFDLLRIVVPHLRLSSPLGETSQFFVSKSPNDQPTESGTFSVGISGPSTVFLDANETEHGYEVSLLLSSPSASVLIDETISVPLQTDSTWKVHHHDQEWRQTYPRKSLHLSRLQ